MASRKWLTPLLALGLVSSVGFVGPAGSGEPAPATQSAAGEAGENAVNVSDGDVSTYLAGYPKMTAFLAQRGMAAESAGAAAIPSSVPGYPKFENDFVAAVGLPFARFFELHAAVSAAFAEALGERSREQQKKSLSDALQEAEKQLKDSATPAEAKEELNRFITESKTSLAELSQPVPPEPAVTPATRKSVRARLDEIEKVFTEQALPRQPHAPGLSTPATRPPTDR